MSVTSGNADTDAILTSLAALPTTFNGSLTGAVDINAAFTLASGYLVRPPAATPTCDLAGRLISTRGCTRLAPLTRGLTSIGLRRARVAEISRLRKANAATADFFPCLHCHNWMNWLASCVQDMHDGVLGKALTAVHPVRQVFFMHCGFAMISVGCVRSKFAKHIAMLILTDACASGIAWYFFG